LTHESPRRFIQLFGADAPANTTALWTSSAIPAASARGREAQSAPLVLRLNDDMAAIS